MKIKEIKKYLILILVLILAAFFCSMNAKANIGVGACWDSVGINVSEITGMKIGTFTIIVNTAFVILQMIILKKDFSPARFLQIPASIIFGMAVNFSYYNVLTFELSSYLQRFLLWIMSNIGGAAFIGAITVLNIVVMPVEAVCAVLSERTKWGFAKWRWGVDMMCVITSITLSLAFGLSFKVREGTLLGAMIFGPLMGQFMKFEKKYINKII